MKENRSHARNSWLQQLLMMEKGIARRVQDLAQKAKEG